MSFGELYRRLRTALAAVCGDAAAYEARQMMEAVCGIRHDAFPALLADAAPLPADAVGRAEEMLSRRMGREPLEYILGCAWFCGLPFAVTPDVLIPQADTEVVCEQVRARLPVGGRLADICTGSGCIALAALSRTENTSAVGYDLSAAALTVAEKNADALGLAARFEPVHADVFAPDFMAGDGLFDVIVSNPPYIQTKVIDTLAPEVRVEPRMALDGGADGLDFYRRLLAVCPAHGKRGGFLIFEIGYDERAALDALCGEYGFSPCFYRDFGGNDRVCVIPL